MQIYVYGWRRIPMEARICLSYIRGELCAHARTISNVYDSIYNIHHSKQHNDPYYITSHGEVTRAHTHAHACAGGAEGPAAAPRTPVPLPPAPRRGLTQESSRSSVCGCRRKACRSKAPPAFPAPKAPPSMAGPAVWCCAGGSAGPCRAVPSRAAPRLAARRRRRRAARSRRGAAPHESAHSPPPPSCLAAARRALRRRAYIAAPTSPHRRSSPRGPALPAVMRCLPVSVRVWDSFGGVPNRQPPLRGVGRGLGSWGASGRRHSCQ